jgi:predicted secreted protein
MSKNAVEAQGTKFSISIGSPTSWQAIPEIRTLGGPDGSSPTIDVTDLDSTAREYIPGLKDEGTFALGIMYRMDNAVHAAMRQAWADRTQCQFKVEWTDPGTTVWTFDGYVTSFSGSAGVDTVVEATVNIRISGAITEA